MKILKSLISSTGCAEFAKRFVVKGMSKEISPVSAKAVLNLHHPYGLFAVANKYHIKRFSTFCRLGGAGYRTLSSLSNIKSKKWMRYWSMWNKLSLPLDLWLGRGKPLNPYLRGFIINNLRNTLRPQELRVPPDDLFFTEEQRTFQEYTQLRGWVTQWLKYVKWYWEVAVSDRVTIQELMDGPVVQTSWKINNRDENLVRFGHLWKCHDLISSLGLNWRAPILPADNTTRPGWLLGGTDGTAFLVQSYGLTQPKADRGVVFIPSPEPSNHK